MNNLQHPELTCEQVESRLAQLVEDRGTKIPAEVVVHAGSCEHCRAGVADFTLLLTAIPQWRVNVPDADLADGVLLQIANAVEVAPTNGRPHLSTPVMTDRTQVESRGSRTPLVVVLAAAVCLLLCFQISLRSRDKASELVSVEQAPLPVEEAPIEVPLSPEPPHTSSSADIRLVNFSHTAVDAMTELAKSVVPMIDDEDVESLDNSQGFVDQLEPIGQGVDRMVDRLIETFNASTSNS